MTNTGIHTKNMTNTGIHTKNMTGTRIINIGTDIDTKNSIHTKNTVNSDIIENDNLVHIKEDSELRIYSYQKKKKKNIFLHKLINKGSYNKIYDLSIDKNTPKDPNLIIRISNPENPVEIINSELNGTKIQHELCSLCNNIGIVVDYGCIYNKNKDYKIQEFSIVGKYGYCLTDFLKLSKKPKYQNFKIIIRFLYELLQAIDCIHSNNYAHLDLKSCNILLDKNLDIYDTTKNITKIKFAILDFGGAYSFSNDKSIELSEQMASAAFSPPELLLMKFGKKSDIWAYGVIIYMICIGKFFFDGGCKEIFVPSKDIIITDEDGNTSLDTEILNQFQEKIHDHFDKKFIKKIGIKNKKFLPDKTSNDLINFFKKIFNVNINDRYNTSQLLKHPIFEFLD